MTGQEVRTAVLDGLALVEAQLGKDREGIHAILAASDDPDHLRTVAEVAAAVASYAIGGAGRWGPDGYRFSDGDRLEPGAGSP